MLFNLQNIKPIFCNINPNGCGQEMQPIKPTSIVVFKEAIIGFGFEQNGLF